MKITENKLQLVLCWTLVALTVATVVIAVQNAQIKAELKEVREKLDYLETPLERIVHPRRILRSLYSSGLPNYNYENKEPTHFRLPGSVIPTNYDLYLHPNIATGNFSGQEEISIIIKETTNQIILHSHKLKITHVYVTTSVWEHFEVNNFYLDPTKEFLVINMAEALEKGATVLLGISFEGEMIDKIVGLYSSTYLTDNNVRKAIATSKFEPTYARQSFPCFDEPSFKATFDVVLVHPTIGYHALSNMNEQKSITQGDYTEVYFHRSVPMSTYLSCFIISDFEHNTKFVNTNGIGSDFDIRIFATSHQLKKVNFALETAVEVIKFYIQYFQVEYPLPKLDMAAIPDFVSNAMEHWGLVTYRETALLYDKSFSSTWNKQRVAAVVAHELAHMWFGNLVTMMWWNDLWLSEGFARYMEYKSLNEIYPEWGMRDQFLVHALHSVMKYDSTVASHPIIQTVETPDQITEIFDTISYEKGASVIRMLEDTIGSSQFALAVSNYLTNYKYQNAITDDFITELVNLNLDFDIKLMMTTWTEQMGYPLVEVKRSTNNQFTLTQKRFLSNIEDYNTIHSDSKFNYTWTIPLTFLTDSNKEIQRIWFPYDAIDIEVTVAPTTKWVKFNSHQVGYYRVNYDEDLWRDIILDLTENPVGFDISDRAHLLDDTFALADAGQLTYDIALDITKYLYQERDFVPWYVATNKLQDLQKNLMHTETIVDYLQYARNLIKNVYNEIGWEVDQDNHLNNRLRVSIMSASCALGLPDCLNHALDLFNTWLENPMENIPEPDLRELVYFFGMQEMSKPNVWQKMWDIFVEEKDPSEKMKLMYGLSGVQVPWLLRRFIDLAENEEYIRRQDYFTCIQNIAANPVGTPIVWEYVRENWPALVERFGLNERYLGRMILSITSQFASDVKLDEMNAFFTKYPEAGAGTVARNQAIETVKYNIIWQKNNNEKVANWLRNNKETTVF